MANDSISEEPLAQLSAIQTWMQTSLIDPQKEEEASRITHYISPVKNMTVQERLAIYQRAYYSRLIECMHGQFKALLYTLGNELFDDFSRMYLKKIPSSSPSLAHLGEQFPAFLQEIRPDKAAPETWVNFMIAMAQFEVDLYRIFDQEGSEGKRFANELTKDENLTIQACFSLHQYPFEVNRYYQEVAAENKPEITAAYKTYVAFVRTNYQVYVIPLTEVQYILLGSIKQGKTISTALKGLVEQYNLIPEKVTKRWLEWKKDWIQKGFFLVQQE